MSQCWELNVSAFKKKSSGPLDLMSDWDEFGSGYFCQQSPQAVGTAPSPNSDVSPAVCTKPV